jgi:hypothetical protein
MMSFRSSKNMLTAIDRYHDNPFTILSMLVTTQSTHKLHADCFQRPADGICCPKKFPVTWLQTARLNFGYKLDPLTSLAILFPRLSYDAGQRGLRNAQLIKEDKEMGDKYRNKSVAEQHSLDSSDLLMSAANLKRYLPVYD